jgi:hypothetical protein
MLALRDFSISAWDLLMNTDRCLEFARRVEKDLEYAGSLCTTQLFGGDPTCALYLVPAAWFEFSRAGGLAFPSKCGFNSLENPFTNRPSRLVPSGCCFNSD